MTAQTLTGYFERFGKTVWTIIGSGGKTSLLWLLAEHYRASRTLVTTTTRMMCPDSASGLFDYLITEHNIPHFLKTETPIGITLAGHKEVTETAVKFRSLPLEMLETLIPHFEYVYIEGDGSKMLPLKAWAEWEPVVPESSGGTVGILPLWPIGLPVSETIIHRLPLWKTLTGSIEDEILTLRHLALAITGSTQQRGLFKAAHGRRLLFFNQVEDAVTLQTARELTAMLPSDFTKTLEGIIAGSVKHNIVTELL